MAVSPQALSRLLLQPLRVEGTGMYPATLLSCKLLWMLTIAHHIEEQFVVPFLPLWQPLDVLLPVGGFLSTLLVALYVAGGAALLFNFRPRTACVILGGCVLFMLLGNRVHYRNHLFIVACMFLLSACHRENERPWLLILQAALIYLAAGWNKIWEADWRSGQFMEAWLSDVTTWYGPAAKLFPDDVLGMMLGWGTIVFEIMVGVMFLRSARLGWAVWLAVGFHLGLFIALGGETFGHFMQDILILFIAFIPWEPAPASSGGLNRRGKLLRQPMFFYCLLVGSELVKRFLPHAVGFPFMATLLIGLWLLYLPRGK